MRLRVADGRLERNKNKNTETEKNRHIADTTIVNNKHNNVRGRWIRRAEMPSYLHVINNER